jgi:hypothetical protein
MNEMVRKRVFATIREDVIAWIEKEVEKGRFRSRSHALEYGVLLLMEKDKE